VLIKAMCGVEHGYPAIWARMIRWYKIKRGVNINKWTDVVGLIELKREIKEDQDNNLT
jgi:hypothetical protein